MIKIVILFSIVSWINYVVSEQPTKISCNMKTDENIDDCIKHQLPNSSETENATCTNVIFNLTDNSITKLPEVITDKCNNRNTGICCSYIDIKNNTSTILSVNGSLHVTILQLQNTAIDIPKNMPLLNTTEIIQLVLSSCSIYELYNETFSTLPNLELLFLKNNALSALPENIFKHNNKLQSVNLDNNNLSTIPDGLFSFNTGLKTVYLQNNNLHEVSGGLFENNSLLQKVYLQNNKLTMVPGELFKNNSDLQTVYLENNNLTDMPNELFTKNTNLTTVSVTNNSLTEIVVYYNKSLIVHIQNQTINIGALCMNVSFHEGQIIFIDSVKPNCIMFEKTEHTTDTILMSTTTATINTTKNSTENSTEQEDSEFKKYAWLYFFGVILFQLIILIILIVLYIRDKDDVSQKID